MNMQFSKEQVENGDIANRYLQGQLSPEETMAFEIYLLEHPELLEQLNIDQVFIDAIGSVDIQKTDNTEESKSTSFWPNFKWLGLGAIGAYVSVALFSMLMTNSVMMNVDRVVYVETVRSSDPVQKRIRLSDKDERMVLMLSTSFDQEGPFDVSIVRVDTNQVVAEFKGVPKTETDDIAIIVDSGLFEVGGYNFELVNNEGNQKKITLVEFSS